MDCFCNPAATPAISEPLQVSAPMLTVLDESDVPAALHTVSASTLSALQSNLVDPDRVSMDTGDMVELGAIGFGLGLFAAWLAWRLLK